jgi:hypothetical protein
MVQSAGHELADGSVSYCDKLQHMVHRHKTSDAWKTPETMTPKTQSMTNSNTTTSFVAMPGYSSYWGPQVVLILVYLYK